MDRVENPPLSGLSGQLKLGLVEEYKKETVWEDLVAFAQDLLSYSLHRVLTLLSYFPRFFISGFTLTDQFKFWLSRKFVRRRGQLSFPFAHAALVGVSLSLLVLTTGIGGFIFKNSEPILADLSASILSDEAEFITEESDLTKTETFTYVVREGQDIYAIAEQFGRTVDAIASANRLQENERGNYTVDPGQILTIPPIEGVDYIVKETDLKSGELGDIVARIAKKYSSNAQQIVEFNYIFSKDDLYPGRKILIPVDRSYLSGDFSAPAGACKADVKYGWPTKSRSLIGSYVPSHRGIDLLAAFNEELYSVGEGVVSAVANFPQRCMSFGAGCNYGYGGLVFIDLLDSAGKPTGLQARYGHINKPLVGVGQPVGKGQLVAQAGESGVTFGPHLHFEIYCGGAHQRVNPLPYLE